MEPNEQPGILHEEVGLLFIPVKITGSILQSCPVYVVLQRRRGEEDLTRWPLASCLEKSGSGEESSHMCVYV